MDQLYTDTFKRIKKSKIKELNIKLKFFLILLRSSVLLF